MLQLRYRPLPFNPSALRSFLPFLVKQIFPLAALFCFDLCWIVLAQPLPEWLNGRLPACNCGPIWQYYRTSPAAVLIALGLTLLLALSEQLWRLLIAYRCQSLQTVLALSILVGLIWHLASPLSGALVTVWLVLLASRQADPMHLLALQWLYNLLVWGFHLLVPEQLLTQTLSEPGFALLILPLALAALLYLGWCLIKLARQQLPQPVT
jgi:hypothetical protein